MFSTYLALSDRGRFVSIEKWASLRTLLSPSCAWWLALRLGLLCILFGSLSVARGADFDLSMLMHDFAQVRVQRGTFVERRYLGMLEHPLESSGELVYRAPDYLEERTLLPQSEALVLEGDMLTLSRGTKKQTVWLYQYPEIGALVACVRSLLAGDEKSLEAAFEVRLEGSEDKWQLDLTPKLGDIQKVIRHIEIRGRQTFVLSVEIRQPDHDRSVMTIENSPAPR